MYVCIVMDDDACLQPPAHPQCRFSGQRRRQLHDDAPTVEHFTLPEQQPPGSGRRLQSSFGNKMTPPPIRGNWRGLEIQGGYVTGEWLVVFKENTVLITHVADAHQSPKHRHPWEATVSLWGGRNADITLTPTAGKDKGKAIYCIYSLQTGKRLSKMTLAMAKPGSETAPDRCDVS